MAGSLGQDGNWHVPQAGGSHRPVPPTSSLIGEVGPSDVARAPSPRALPSDAFSRAPARVRTRTPDSGDISWVIATWTAWWVFGSGENRRAPGGWIGRAARADSTGRGCSVIALRFGGTRGGEPVTAICHARVRPSSL